MRNNKRMLFGILFIIVGALFLFLNINIFQGYWALLFVGLLFYALYKILGGPSHINNLGIIISASFSLLLWILFFMHELTLMEHDGFFLIFLGIAFILSFVIHIPPNQPPIFWLLYTGGILIVLGTGWVFAFAIWPLFFIFLGIMMLAKS